MDRAIMIPYHRIVKAPNVNAIGCMSISFLPVNDVRK
jgi:hypothetical protein